MRAAPATHWARRPPGRYIRRMRRITLGLLAALAALRTSPAAAERPRSGPALAPTAIAAASATVRVGVAIAERPRRRYVVAAIGDSLTDERVGGGLYMKVLSERCRGSRFDAFGVGGQRTDHMRWRFRRDVFGAGLPPGQARPDYTHVLVLGGINDLAAGTPRSVSVGRIQKNLSAMYESARRRGLAVVALTIPPWMGARGMPDARRRATSLLNDWILDQRGQGKVTHAVDIRPPLRCGEDAVLCPAYRRFADDPIHWGHRGHEVVGELLQKKLFADCL